MAMVDNLGLLCNNCASLAAIFSPINQHNENGLCRVYVFIRALCLGSSSFLILLMSCERVFASYVPFRYKNIVTTKLLAAVGATCIVFAGLFSLASALSVTNEEGQCFSLNQELNEKLTMTVIVSSSLLFFLVPSISSAVLNFLIIIKIKQKKSGLVYYFYFINQSILIVINITIQGMHFWGSFSGSFLFPPPPPKFLEVNFL